MKYKFTSKYERGPLHVNIPINRLDGYSVYLELDKPEVYEVPDDQDIYAGHGTVKILEKKGRLIVEKVEEEKAEEPQKEQKAPEPVKAKEEPKKEDKKVDEKVFAFGDKGKDKDDKKKKDKR